MTKARQRIQRAQTKTKQVKVDGVATPKAPKVKAPQAKTFDLHWGSGMVEEEAMITTSTAGRACGCSSLPTVKLRGSAKCASVSTMTAAGSSARR